MKKIFGILMLSFISIGAQATLLTGEVAEDAYVKFAGYDLAWASPCSDGLLEDSCGAIDLSEQSAYGWAVMTSELFESLGINASTFLVDYSSSNTQLYEDNHYAKAAGWFSNLHSHIDVKNGLDDLWSFADVADGAGYYETIVYRLSDKVDVSVPESGSIALLVLALAGLGLSRRNA